MDSQNDHGSAPSHWLSIEPGRLIARGHPAGDFLEAYDWRVVVEDVGCLEIDAHLPDRVLNPRGHLFGGFTPTYVELVSLHVARAGPDRTKPDTPRTWMATVNMRVDYFEPITGPRFTIKASVEHRRNRNWLVSTQMFQDGTLATYALTTMRSQDPIG
ncbi:MAG: hypothetical protein GY773_32915 [Actinomycetia bacterium]|nr:hypothetical protein [Actinomycetes bacterium]